MAARAEGFENVRAAAGHIIIQHPGKRKEGDEPKAERLTERTYIYLQYAGANAL